MNNCLICVDVYQVQAGDTLYSIARRYNISTGLLMRANMLEDPYSLKVGLKLCIPGFENEKPASPGEGPIQAPTPSLPSQPEIPEHDMPVHSPCKGTLHTVEAGDTLYMIAKKYRVNLDAIIAANPGTDPYNLMIGMQLCIPR